MAVIGTLGDIVFSVSEDKISTISDVKWESTANFGEHKRHLGEPLLEFTGNSTESISFNMYFSAFLGVNPIEEIGKLLTAERSGLVMPLYIGSKAYGTHRWVISKLSIAMKRYDREGNLLDASVSVTLKSYSAR